MSMLPPPTPILPRLQGHAPEESLLLETVAGWEMDTTLDDADFMIRSGRSHSSPSTLGASNSFASSSSTPRMALRSILPIQEDNGGEWDAPEVGRGTNGDLSLDLDAYLPGAEDATLLRDTSIGSVTSLPPPLSPEEIYSPYARPSSAMGWGSSSTPGPSRLGPSLKRTPSTVSQTPSSVKRSRTPLPVESTPHKDDFYSRRMSDASRRASFGTPAFSVAEREREDLRRRISRESLRRSASMVSLGSQGGDSPANISRRSDFEDEPEVGRHHTPRRSIATLPFDTPRDAAPSLVESPANFSTGNVSTSFTVEEKIVESPKESARRLSTPAKVLGFFAGLLGRSSSSSSLREEIAPESENEAREEPQEEQPDAGDVEQEQEEGYSVRAPHAVLYDATLTRAPLQTTTINAPPLRQAAPPKSAYAYPYVAPLTRPLAPRFATDARSSRPIQKDAAPRPLAVREQNKVIGSSAFAKAALAKLPPPGRGSTSAGEKVNVKAGEHPKDFGGVRNVWERLAQENRPTALGSGPKRSEAKEVMKRTVPIQGHTPGKASLARAREREAREAIRRERRAEMEATKAKRR